MIMRLVVPVVTALVLLTVGVFWMFVMLVGTNGYNTSVGGTILVGNVVVVILTVIIASVASGWLAHVLQARSGISPWLVGPLTVVAVTAVAVVAIFIGGIVVTSVIDGALRRPPPQQQPPAADGRRGGR